MNREALDSLDKEALIRLVLTQAETIAALNRQVEMLTAWLSCRRLPRPVPGSRCRFGAGGHQGPRRGTRPAVVVRIMFPLSRSVPV